jgi:hypothetical protein
MHKTLTFSVTVAALICLLYELFAKAKKEQQPRTFV